MTEDKIARHIFRFTPDEAALLVTLIRDHGTAGVQELGTRITEAVGRADRLWISPDEITTLRELVVRADVDPTSDTLTIRLNERL